MGRDCKLSIKNTCFSRTNAKCVDYDGCIQEYSTLDKEKCYNSEDIICELGNLVDEINNSIDVSSLGCCMTYTADDEEKGLLIKEVLSAHEGMLCDHEERLNNLEDNCGNN